jgi:hypothetical protein
MLQDQKGPPGKESKRAYMAGYGCLLPFDSDDPEFARGFELGRLWELLRERPEDEVLEYAHAANAEMLIRLGEATSRRVRSEELGGGWLSVTFEPEDSLTLAD